MEQTECSETPVYKIQTPGNYPEESTQHSEHGESLKSIILHLYGDETAKTHSTVRKTPHQENKTPLYLPYFPLSLQRSEQHTLFLTVPSPHPLPSCQ